ncbi:hypothetical protein PM082_000695 [Marasmius tenuissimus]|nr:hypothetical protein PM082_000695 [Marasmius tenuissimus]
MDDTHKAIHAPSRPILPVPSIFWHTTSASIGMLVTKAEFEAGVNRLGDIMSDGQRQNGILRATGEEAQEWLDLMQLLVEYPETPKSLRSCMLKMMIRLSRTTGLHPKCLTIQNVERIGRHPISGGAFADIWKGKMGGSVVCMKILRIYSTSDIEQVLKDYTQEAIIWRQLDHTNVLPFRGIYHLEDDTKRLCLISPWMERGNLVQFMNDSPELVNRGSLAWDVARGLSHLHNMKVIHGDLKGANVLITRDLRARISDFGLSRISDTQRLFSLQTYHLSGTTRWLAPELLRYSARCVATKESDVYAYACVCYEIFVGRCPFHDLPEPAVICAVLIDEQRPSRPQGLPELQDSMWDVMVRCWDTRPSSRPTMTDVLEELQEMGFGGSPGTYRQRRDSVWRFFACTETRARMPFILTFIISVLLLTLLIDFFLTNTMNSLLRDHHGLERSDQPPILWQRRPVRTSESRPQSFPGSTADWCNCAQATWGSTSMPMTLARQTPFPLPMLPLRDSSSSSPVTSTPRSSRADDERLGNAQHRYPNDAAYLYTEAL